MSSLRTLISELVEKRLWPVAVLLLVALVAVPFVLARSPDAPPQATTTTPPVAAAGAASAEPAVSVIPAPARRAPLRGRAKNPFHQQHVPPKDATANGGGTAPVEPGSTPDGSGKPSSGGGSSGGAPTKPPKTYAVAAIDVRFGKASGRTYRHGQLPRLAPLPGPARPLVIFLGMKKDLRTAVFLISSDVHAQGDGTCTPSRAHCTTVELREGDVLLLDATGPSGHVRHYELDLTQIEITHTTSKADAQRAYARVSGVGARLLGRRARVSARNTVAGGRPDRIPYRYAVARGVLHIAPFLSRRIAR
jgi:hypothetical protein